MRGAPIREHSREGRLMGARRVGADRNRRAPCLAPLRANGATWRGLPILPVVTKVRTLLTGVGGTVAPILAAELRSRGGETLAWDRSA